MSVTSRVIKYLPLSFQVGKEMTKTVAEVQKSSASRETGGMTQEEPGTEKPESRLGSLLRLTGAIQQEQQPVVYSSYCTIVSPDVKCLTLKTKLPQLKFKNLI